MSIKEQYWKYSLIVIILFMGIIIFRQITPFLGGLLGALTIYILVRTQMTHLTEKWKLKRSVAALLITAETVMVFLVPLGLTIWLLVNQLQDINLDPQTFIAPMQQVAEFIKEKTGYDVLGKDTLSFIVSILPRIGQIIMESISSLAINLFVMVFVLYFMLIGGKKMEAYVNDILPFNETNTQEVIHEINMIVRSNAIGIPLLAIIQGGVAMIGYLLFGAPNAEEKVVTDNTAMNYELPDGSSVQVMENSRLTYNHITWLWERKLQLLGKASFNVTKGKTFTVSTEAGDVTVLGTKFLVDQQGKKMFVNCEEGSVKVETAVGNHTLLAGESVRCDETKIVPVEKKAEESEFPEVLGYEDDPLINVVADIEHIFKVTVVGHEKCEGLTYNGTVLTKDLNATLEKVFGSCGISYQIRGKEIILK